MLRNRFASRASRAVLAVSTAALAACGTEEAAPPSEPISTTSVHTTSYPLAYFAERIGGEYVDVVFPAPAGTDPALWSPDATTVIAYQGADVILVNGAGYEWWIATASLPANRVVDTTAGFADEFIVTGSYTHSHGDEGEHSHAQTASVTWIDPGLAVRQAEAVRDALVAARPEGAARFNDAFASLAADLTELDSVFAAATSGLDSHHLLAASRDYAYFGNRYGLEIGAIHFDASIDAGEYIHEVEHALEHSKTMLWPSTPPAELAARLEGLGVRTVVFDLAAARPSRGDYLEVMRANAAALGALGE